MFFSVLLINKDIIKNIKQLVKEHYQLLKKIEIFETQKMQNYVNQETASYYREAATVLCKDVQSRLDCNVFKCINQHTGELFTNSANVPSACNECVHSFALTFKLITKAEKMYVFKSSF